MFAMKNIALLVAVVTITLFISACKKEKTEEQGSIELVENVFILESESRDALVQVTAQELVFSQPSLQLDTIAVGDFIVSEPTETAPDGLLRRVTFVQAQGSELRLYTQEAALSDIIASGEINLEIYNDPADTLRSNRFKYPLGVVWGEVSATGNLDFNIDVTSLNFGDWAGEPFVRYDPEASFDMNLTVESKEAFAAFSASQKLKEWSFKPIVRYIPTGLIPLPLVISRKLTVSISASGRADGAFKYSGSASGSLGANVSYQQGWSFDTHHTFDATGSQQSKGVGYMTVSVQPNFVFGLYGTQTGITFGPKCYLSTDNDSRSNPPCKTAAGLALDFSVQAGTIKSSIPVFSQSLTLAEKIFEQCDFSGIWLGIGYQCPAGTLHNERVTITHDGDKISAIKIDGDDCVTAGQTTFTGTYNSFARNFGVTWATGLPGNPNSSSAYGTLMAKSLDTLIAAGIEPVIYVRQ